MFKIFLANSLVAVLSINAFCAHAQKHLCGKVYNSVENKAVYGNGQDSFRRFLERHLTFGDCMKEEENYPGYLVITLLIDKNGAVQDVHFKSENLTPECEKELQQIFLKMPKW